MIKIPSVDVLLRPFKLVEFSKQSIKDCTKLTNGHLDATPTRTHSEGLEMCACVTRDATRARWPGAICPHGSHNSTAPQSGRTSQQHSHCSGLFRPTYPPPPFFLRLKPSQPKFCPSLMKLRKPDRLQRNSRRGNYQAPRGLCCEIKKLNQFNKLQGPTTEEERSYHS